MGDTDANQRPFTPYKGISIPESERFLLLEWHSESWVLESGIQLKESGTQPTIGIQDLLKNIGIQYLESGIQSVESRNTGLSLRRKGYNLTLILKAFFLKIKSGKNDKRG